MTAQTIEISNQINKTLGTNIELVHAPTIKPFDTAFFKKNANRYNHIFTFEEHSIIGGLGSCVSETITSLGFQDLKLHTFGIKDKFLHNSVSQIEARKFHGIDPMTLIKKIIKILK